MPLEIQKQNRENGPALLRRFSRAVQGSGILLEARKNRFKTREKSKDVRKKSALRRIVKKSEYEKLKKLGEVK